MIIRTGYSGWSYSSWLGRFYPSTSKQSELLLLYSRVFDTVEVDSTFYIIPGKRTVTRRLSSTPDNFIFKAKLPKRSQMKRGSHHQKR